MYNATRFLGLLVFVASLLAAPRVVHAQYGASPGSPNADLQSREVHPDRRVTFRIYAPAAKQVRLADDVVSSREPVPFTRDDRGVWNGTTPPLEPGQSGQRSVKEACFTSRELPPTKTLKDPGSASHRPCAV